ncbi:MAG: XdhC family protein [Bacteroidetes bacterium]|nr:MAG: XdhC family protein [Bacteroidota bacterium]
MKEIREIIRQYDAAERGKHRFALATVVHVEGSSYRKEGARMLVREDGIWTGGISGGCLERDALRKAQFALLKDRAQVVTYDTTLEDEKQIGVGLGCNGIIDVLMAPIRSEDPHNPLEVLRSCLPLRETSLVLTLIADPAGRSKIPPGGALRLTTPDDLEAHFPPEALESLREEVEAARSSGRSRVTALEGMELFVEVLPPAPRVVICGGQYDVYPLLRLSRELGWLPELVYDSSKASREMMELSEKVHASLESVPVDERTAFLIMAHDFRTDKENLRLALQTEVPYIGMLGPVKRRNKIIAELESEGTPLQESDRQRLFNPVGLDIGSTTPETIALAILAEIQGFFAGKDMPSLRTRQGAIHARD